MTAAIFGLGPLELLIIVAIVIVLFLPALLPRIIKRFGETFSTVRDMAEKGLDEDDEDAKKKKKDKSEE